MNPLSGVLITTSLAFNTRAISGNYLKPRGIIIRKLFWLMNYIKTSKPTYCEFEAWVKKNGTKVDKGSIDKLNSAIKGYIHDDGTRKGILGANGLPDDASACKDAVNLNNLDDWKEFHEAALK